MMKSDGNELRSNGFGPEDVGWTGEDCSLDTERLLKEHGFGSVLLEAVLLRIIQAHPSASGESDQERLEIALKALTGVHRVRGNDNLDDEELLVKIAWRYHVERYHNRRAPQLAPIVRCVIEELAPGDDRRRASADSVVRRLTKKFNKNRDLWLALATVDGWERHEAIARQREIFRRLELLGLPVSEAKAPLEKGAS